MNSYELEFYEAGIKDANEQKCIVVSCRSKRYISLIKKFGTQIGDKRGNGMKAYCEGIAFEFNR
ncbi:Uncharacterised protein [Mycobacterium tuberculosis]|nr:Uncharacterised protein [Mycobacterium tuberculosis]